MRLALCGIVTALGTVLMLMAGIITVGTYTFPALAGMLGIAIVFPAWRYACSKGKGWRIVCIIMFILYFVLAICGNIIF